MWKKLSERLAYQGWRSIKIKEFELPNGRIAEYDIVSTKSFVTVAAFTQSGEAILIRQFRPGPERELLSFCEGAIDADETPLQAARRELREETGYEAGTIHFLKMKQNAYTDQQQHFFVATDCQLKHEPQPDEGEFLSLEIQSVAALRTLLRDIEDDSFANIDAAYLALDWLGMRNEE